MNRTAIILAAGQGSRMKSTLAKPLHPIAGHPMLYHVLDAAKNCVDTIVVVVGHQAEAVKTAISTWEKSNMPVAVVHQDAQNGTGHATLCAQEHTPDGVAVVLFADSPLITTQTIETCLAHCENTPQGGVAVGMIPDNPTGYGRMITHDTKLERIVEEKDATQEERALTLVNTGIIAAHTPLMFDTLNTLPPSPTTGEFYLTSLPDVIPFEITICDLKEAAGVNDRIQLALAERYYQDRKRQDAMRQGATLLDPETTYFSFDTKLGKDVLVEPNVFFGPGVHIHDNVTIKANTHIEGTTLHEGTSVGPFARLRPGTILEANTRVGNFVETKNTRMREGAKAGHLSYLGDADIGSKANIGAGTITCNYDGVNKHQTIIGKNAFIGSNSALVAPIEIGEYSLVAAGSTLTHDVPNTHLAFGRARQQNKPKG